MDNLCIGTAQFGMDYGIANKVGKPDKTEVRRIVQTASERNIYFYDTAASYGNSESLLGEIFSDLSINNKVQIITKLSPDFDFKTPACLKDNIHDSLNRLQIDSLWGLMLHRTEIEGDWDEFLEAVSDLKKEKTIGRFGISVYHPEDALKYAAHPCFDIIQVPFNVLDKRLIDNSFFACARENNKSVFIRSVFLQGLLLMEEPEMDIKQMSWAKPYIKYVNDFIEKKKMDQKAFMIHSILKSVPWAKLVVGMETHEQLLKNIDLFQEEEISNDCIANWWTNLPAVPEKLVNPSMW